MNVDFRYAEESIKKTGKTFYFAFRFMDLELRNFYYAIHAFLNHTDDLVDHNEDNPKLQLALMREWKKKFLEAYKRGHSSDPVLGPFVYVMKKYKIPLHYPLELIKGVRSDIRKKDYNTFSELCHYCSRVTGATGAMLMYGLGAKDLRKAKKYAAKLGIAMQLTDILRDVGEDARMGRVYFPKDELARFGLTTKDVLSLRKTPHLKDFLKFYIGRVRSCYKEAEPLNNMVMTHKGARLATSLAFTLHREMLKVVEENGYDVYKRAYLSTPHKVLIAMRVMLFGFSPS